MENPSSSEPEIPSVAPPSDGVQRQDPQVLEQSYVCFPFLYSRLLQIFSLLLASALWIFSPIVNIVFLSSTGKSSFVSWIYLRFESMSYGSGSSFAPVFKTFAYDGAEQKADMPEEEVKITLEAVVSTGKFWQDWEKLKGTLSSWLKKVLSEYPEAKMTDEQQKEALGETFSELVSRLDEALLSYDEGPPFTLQRLCEILLAARTIYPKLSKLALALEKNLLVTSMLAISKDPQSQTTEDPIAATTDTKTAAANWAPNGIEAMGGDKDEIMTEVDEADVDDAMTVDMETIDEPSETITTTSESETPGESTTAQPPSDSVATAQPPSDSVATAQPPSDSISAEEGNSRLA